MSSTEELLRSGRVIVDVRSPSEFASGHIPDAVSIPLFTDEERAVVGTAYVQHSREEAIDVGLGYVGPKLASIVSTARALRSPLLVMCWRGGMRSASVQWLLSTAGLDARTLPGGYKAYRRWVHDVIARPWRYHVVGGRTGSGKSHHLRARAANGEQVLDLEARANHKGSSFGAIGEARQPSTEHFENLVARDLAAFDLDRIVWVEDESRTIGSVHLPSEMYLAMQQAPITVLDVPIDDRIANLVADYAPATDDELVAAFERIRTKLGGERTRDAIDAVRRGDRAHAVRIALTYYDRTYDFCLSKRTPVG